MLGLLYLLKGFQWKQLLWKKILTHTRTALVLHTQDETFFTFTSFFAKFSFLDFSQIQLIVGHISFDFLNETNNKRNAVFDRMKTEKPKNRKTENTTFSLNFRHYIFCDKFWNIIHFDRDKIEVQNRSFNLSSANKKANFKSYADNISSTSFFIFQFLLCLLSLFFPVCANAAAVINIRAHCV